MVEDTMFSGESKNIEYKVSLPDKSEKYMKTIVAFANTQGGKLIVGVDDKTHSCRHCTGENSCLVRRKMWTASESGKNDAEYSCSGWGGYDWCMCQ